MALPHRDVVLEEGDNGSTSLLLKPQGLIS